MKFQGVKLVGNSISPMFTKRWTNMNRYFSFKVEMYTRNLLVVDKFYNNQEMRNEFDVINLVAKIT
jgi:hypothetical protein